MNLKIINGKNENKEAIVLIGKRGVLRITQKLTTHLKIAKNEKWVFGLDLDEEGHYKYIYLLKAKDEDLLKAKRMQFINNTWTIDLNPILKEINIAYPIKCIAEPISYVNHEGFRISQKNQSN